MNNTSSFQSLNSLIESEGGLHFSAYIANYAGAPSLRSQVEEALKVASEDIRNVLSRPQRINFLKPLRSLLDDPKTLSTFKGNIGIFRSDNFFRVLHVPVHVEEFATVASSFHVKPLLKWVQEDRAFRLLAVGEKTSTLYSGTRHSLRHIESFHPPTLKKAKSIKRLSDLWMTKTPEDIKNENLHRLLMWIEDKLNEETPSLPPPLFIVGPKDLKEFLNQSLSYPDIRLIDLENTKDLAKAVAKIRFQLQDESEESIRARLFDFRVAQALDLTESDVQKISKAAKKGLIRKLIVAEDRKIFGKINKASGNVTLHVADIDHEDEDILDDIAQEVAKQGGEVLVAPLRKIPGQRPLLAIADAEGFYPLKREIGVSL